MIIVCFFINFCHQNIFNIIFEIFEMSVIGIIELHDSHFVHLTNQLFIDSAIDEMRL